MCEFDLFSKYAWVAPIKYKIVISIVNAFPKIISKISKSNKIWVGQRGEFYNNLFNRFLKNNKIEMYSTNNAEKSVVAEAFIRTLKNNIFKHITSILKNVCFHVLFDIVKKTITQFIKLLK